MVEKLIYNVGTVDEWESESMINYGKKLLDKIFESGTDNKVAVSVVNTDEVGIVESNEIFIYDSYTNALGKINKYEYSANTAVDVYEINKFGYSMMLSKSFSGVCYSRFAGVKFQGYQLSDIRKLFDCESLIYYCYGEIEEKM